MPDTWSWPAPAKGSPMTDAVRDYFRDQVGTLLPPSTAKLPPLLTPRRINRRLTDDQMLALPVGALRSTERVRSEFPPFEWVNECEYVINEWTCPRCSRTQREGVACGCGIVVTAQP